MDKKVLFLAIDEKTWHEGSGNRGIYAGWKDTHHTVESFQEHIDGVIAQKPIPELDESIPQYITSNTYKIIKILADHAFENFKGQTVAITGTAGKSTSKNLMRFLLGKNAEVVATRGNHNTRTGVPLTVACAITQPEYLIVESAISGLWTTPHGIMKYYPPSVALITSIDGGQRKSAHETAIFKAKIAEGMDDEGTVVLNRDMNEFEHVYENVREYNRNIITYGFDETADTRVTSYKEMKTGAAVEASILGEEVAFTTRLDGQAMTLNIIGVLTVIKTLGVPLNSVLNHIEEYVPSQGVLNFESHKKHDGSNFTILDDGWNATGISMIEAIKIVNTKAKYFKGKKVLVLGRIENLGPEEAVRQHEALVAPILNSEVDIVFAHGPEMKHTLKSLPEHLIGGYFESSKDMAEHIANIIEEDDLILIKGSPRSSDFKLVKQDVLAFTEKVRRKKTYSHRHPYATSAGAATYDISNDEQVGASGEQSVVQNQGLGGILLINHILNQVFSRGMSFSDSFLPGKQELRENKAPQAVKLVENEPVSLESLITAASAVHSPNALLMLANQAVGSNRKTLLELKKKAQELNLDKASVLNITGRRISNRTQKITLEDMYVAGKELFSKFPFIIDYLSQKSFVHNKREYKISSNLYTYGAITHGLFFGHLDSLGIVHSQKAGRKYITVVAGASDAYHRDQLVLESLGGLEDQNLDSDEEAAVTGIENKDEFTINIMGDTYFGEFYTDIRKKRDRDDALMTKGRAYSFDGIRSLLSAGDFNICNFEAAISEEKEHVMKQRKPFVLYSEPVSAETIRDEQFHMVTLANNHLMDCGVEGLERTLNDFKDKNIMTIGAGTKQQEAERPYIKMVNNQRIAIFNAYWYRPRMYREFDFYAVGDRPGVASMSGNILRQIKEEKAAYPEGKIIVIAHWGADFKTVNQKQREYAHSLVSAGTDLIIGHGAHMIQEIERIGPSVVAYSIGNGVFNSDGEYNRRFVAPYSLIAQIVVTDAGLELGLYPVYSNNLKTFWQPRFLEETEFNHCTLMLKSFGSTDLDIKEKDGKSYYAFQLK